MPALVKSSVGSFAGTSDEEWTSRCLFWTKKSRNLRRISEPVSIEYLILNERHTFTTRDAEKHRGIECEVNRLEDCRQRHRSLPRKRGRSLCLGVLTMTGGQTPVSADSGTISLRRRLCRYLLRLMVPA